jgi:hypothetical protein
VNVSNNERKKVKMNAFSIGSRKYVASKGEVCRSAKIDLKVARSLDEILNLHNKKCWYCPHYSGMGAVFCGGYARMGIKTFKKPATTTKGKRKDEKTLVETP